MAQVDSLEISIESSAKKANDAIDSIIKNLGNLSKALNIDTRKLSNIGKNIDLSSISKQAKTISESIGNMGAKMSQSMKPMQDNAKNLETILSKINEKYKDLGKDFQFFGNAQSIQKKIDSLSNSLENAKLKKQELESAGKIEGQMYENAVKDVIKYENQIESLKNQLTKTQAVKISVDTKEIEDAENLVERMKEHIRQQMAGITIKNPLNVAAFSDEEAALFEKIRSEMTQTAESAKKMGEQIEDAIRVENEGGFGTALVPIEKFMESAAEKTKDFEAALNSLKNITPQINETNIDRLQNKLKSTEEQTERLRYELEKGLRLGTIDVNDKKFTDLTVKIKESENQAELLREKIQEVGNASKTTGGVSNSLSNALKKLSSNANLTSNSIKGLTKNLSRSLSGMKTFTRSILSAVGIMGGLYGAIRGGISAIDIASQLTEVQNVVDTTFGDMAYKIEDFAQTSIEQFGMSELTLKQVSSRFQAMGTAMGFPIDQMSDMSVELTKLTADMASFYNVEQEDVAKSLESIFTGTTRPLRQYGLDLTQATLQEWALKQGLDANIQSMSQAEKTMLRYQYVMANTGAAQGDFARTMNTWANQVRILKMNFQELAGIIGGVLINAFKPLVQALNAAMSHIIAFAKTISNALGQIFGWTYEEGGGGFAQDFEDAEDAAGGIADSTGTAAKNIKKMQAGLRAFDELKVINMPEDTDGTGGGAGGAGGAGLGAGAADGGKWVKKDSILKEYESEIKNLFDLGKYISKSLMDAMNSIDWDSVYEKARGFGKGLADFLNGLFAGQNGQTLFGVVGKTIASALNTAIYAALSFGETFDFKQFGYNIADGINNFFETFDFAALAKTINTWANGILNSVITAIDNTDWNIIGNQIGIFLSEIDFIEIGKKIGIALWDAINAGIDLLKGMFNVAPIETAFLTIGIGTIAIAKLMGAFIKLKETMTGIGALFAPITSLFAEGGIFGAEGAIATASTPVLILASAIAALVAGLGITYATNEEVRESFSQAIESIKNGLQPALDFITNTLLPDLNAGWERLLEILSPLGEFLSDMFTSIWQDMINPALTYIGETVLPRLTSAFENLWNNALVPLGTFLADVLEPVLEIISDILKMLWKNVVVPLANAVGNILGKAFEGISEIANDVVGPAMKQAIEIFQFFWNKVLSPIVSFLRDTFKPVFEGVFKAIGGIIDGLSQAFGGLIDFITGAFTGNWQKAWEGVKNIFKGVFNGLISIVEGVINSMIGGINYFLRQFNNVASGIKSITGINLTIPIIPNVSLPKFATGAIVYKPTYAEIGEAGKEGILPLTNRAAMSQMVNEIMASASSDGNYVEKNFGNSSYQTDSLLMKQNQLLIKQNDLLEEILKKPVIGDEEIGKRSVKYIQGEERRLQKSLVGIY